MAKIQIKFEKLTNFGEIFSIMPQILNYFNKPLVGLKITIMVPWGFIS